MRYYQLMGFTRTKTDEGIVYSKNLFTIKKSRNYWKIKYANLDKYNNTYLSGLSFNVLDDAIEFVAHMIAFPEDF